jgi:hypothetical protein
MMLSHLLQPTTPYCVHLRAFSIDRHVNPLIAFGATSTTIEPNNDYEFDSFRTFGARIIQFQ